MVVAPDGCCFGWLLLRVVVGVVALWGVVQVWELSVQQILLRNYRSRLLIQINCTIGGASDWLLLVKCWPLPLVDDGAGALPNAPKDQKQKNARNHTDNGAAPLMGNTHSNILVEDNLHPLSATMQRG